jgi:hypothetical protein
VEHESVPLDDAALRVPLNGFAMQLRRSEVEAVANGLGEFDAPEEGDLLTLAEALRRLPTNERAPTWELVVRRFGHHKPLAQAAGEIGLDEVRARDLLDRYCQLLKEVPAPEHEGLVGTSSGPVDPAEAINSSEVARFMAQEMLGNAMANDEKVDLDAQHEASLRAAEDARENT